MSRTTQIFQEKGPYSQVLDYGNSLVYKTYFVCAINTKTLGVTFSSPVEDTDAASFKVVKGASTNISVSSITWNEDKTEAQLTLDSKVGEGKYTVTVTGVAEDALTGSVETQAETVSKIELTSDVAVLDGTGANLTLGYKVLNQYGEDITSKVDAADLTSSASNKGTVTLDETTSLASIDNSTSALKAGDKVTLTIVHDETGVVVNKQLTVAESAGVAEITFGDIYNEDGLELSEDNTSEDFYVVVNAKDQYGNALKAADIEGNVVITSSKSDVLTYHSDEFEDIKIDGKTVTVLVLDAASMTEGNAKLTITSLLNGTSVQKTFEVKAATKVDTISLEKPDLAVAGEKVVIPFEVTNNYDKEETDLSKLNLVNFTVKGSKSGDLGSVAKFKKNASTGEVELELDLTSANVAGEKVTVVATTPTSKVTTLSLDVKETAKPVAITGLKDINLNHVAGKTVDIDWDNLVFADQYERVYKNADIDGDATPAAPGEYQVRVDVEDTDIVDTDNGSGGNTADLVSGTPVTLYGQKKGATKVKFTLETFEGSSVVDVKDSEFSTTVRISESSEFVSYEAIDVETIYDDEDTNYTEEIKVYGVLANGTKVILPEDAYSVRVEGLTGVSAAAGTNAWTFDANGVTFPTDAKEVKGKAVVTINSTGEALEKEITVSKVAPKVEKVEFTSDVVNGGYTLAADTFDAEDIAELLDETKSKDNYGEVITSFITSSGGTTAVETTFADANADVEAIYFTVSDIVDADKDSDVLTVTGNGTTDLALSNIENGDSFKVTIKFANGVTKTLSVVADGIL